MKVRRNHNHKPRRGTILLMIVGLLAMLFMLVTAYITLARFDRLTVQQAAKGADIESALDGVNELLTDWLAQHADAENAEYADIPGYNLGAVIAGLDPVKQPTADPTQPMPADFAVDATSLTPLLSRPPLRLTDLMLEGDFPGSPLNGVIDVRPSIPTEDAILNARYPFGDADGDGIADSSFRDVARLIELANSMVGIPVDGDINTANRNPTAVETDPARVAFRKWEHFDRNARYEVAARVVPHGGMIQMALEADPDLTPADGTYPGRYREFVPFLQSMFNWIRHPEDDRYLGAYDTPTYAGDMELMARLAREREAIEPLLRTRGGLLVSQGGTDPANLPSALRDLQDPQDGFRSTVSPDYGAARPRLKQDNYQRFNLASLDEWNAWRQAVTVDADAYNEYVEVGGPNPGSRFVPRKLLTTVNYSDELAREQHPYYTKRQMAFGPSGRPAMGIDPGQTKFYLGRVNKCFNDNGSYNGVTGAKLIPELAAYFHEMLSNYDQPNSPLTGDQWNVTEPTNRREQAYMLAVNTVAFAVPRTRGGGAYAAGQTDVVHFTDEFGKTYYGYGPQPHITQVIAYREPDNGDVALAVELFNPFDDYDPATQPADFKLYLPQFALTVGTLSDPDGFNQLAGDVARLANGANKANFELVEYLDGRSFATIIMDNSAAGGSNTYFHTQLIGGGVGGGGILGQNLPIMKSVPVETPNEKIRVNLWKKSLDNTRWVLVDQMELDEPDNPASPPDDWKGSWSDAWRDTRTDEVTPGSGSIWGSTVSGVGLNRKARWRCVAVLPRNMPDGWSPQLDYHDEDDDGEPHVDGSFNRLHYLSLHTEADTSGPGLNTERFGPSTPLYTMNPFYNRWVTLHGAERPAAFPTVGFMLFIPRFTHTKGADIADTADRKPAGEYIYKHWRRRGYLRLADLGHMPSFDNRQRVRKDTHLDQTGSLPWGLFVFDYFTTLDPDGPDHMANTGDELDPYRVPGRININQAPWYVLAGLPVIGPAGGQPLAYLPVGNASVGSSPAFWAPRSGILAGTSINGVARFPAASTNNRLLYDQSSLDPNQHVWRLGPVLAQAAAAYRDRVPYVSVSSYTPNPWPEAWRRGTTGGLYRPARYGLDDMFGHTAGIRDFVENGSTKRVFEYTDNNGNGIFDLGDDSEPLHRGFLTLGELANVMGFDSSTDLELAGGTTTTALGKNDFFRAVSLLALLDTHFLTTRSNTYTVYVTLRDRDNPQASMRAQTTLDRTVALPKMVWKDNGDGYMLPDDESGPPFDRYMVLPGAHELEIISERQGGYYNTRHY